MATRTDIIECPFCGHEHEDYQNYVDPVDEKANFLFDCDNENCQKTFRVEMKVTTIFKTTRLK